MGSKADPTRDRVVQSQSIAEQLRAFRDEALRQLAEAGWPIDRLETLEDLERLSVWAGLTPTERDRMTMDEVCRHAMYVSERRQIERSHRIAEQVVVARKMRQWACQDATGDRGDIASSDVKQATTSDVKQADNTAIATSPSRRVRLLAWRNNRYPSAIVDGLPVPMTDRRHALIRQIIVLQQTRRVTKDDLDEVAGNGRSMLKRMAEKSPWRDVIHFPDSASGNGYRIV